MHRYDVDLNKGLEVDGAGDADGAEEEELPDDLGVPLLTPSRGPSQATY